MSWHAEVQLHTWVRVTEAGLTGVCHAGCIVGGGSWGSRVALPQPVFFAGLDAAM